MNTARPSSLLGRVVLALALSIGFYTLAVAIAGTLVFIPYEIWRVSHDVNVQLTIFCAVSAIVILYSILPRIDAFAAPGPPLAAGDHPRLFKLLEQVANATGQAMPREVYLVPDCNAWVANRGGVVGVGSRRIMGLGLPVLQILSVSEFAAVLAHEFGHYHHGDTALGPWLYRVRQSIGRTLQELAKRKNILVVVFKWYATLFMRITTAVSRRQELGADALAARVAGAGALASGLRALHAWTPIFVVYRGAPGAAGRDASRHRGGVRPVRWCGAHDRGLAGHVG